MSFFFNILVLFPLFYLNIEANPKVERIIGFTPYFRVLERFMEKESDTFLHTEALVFADLMKLVVPKNIVVLGNSNTMYPFMCAYFLRYFGEGKVYHFTVLENKKEAYLQKKLQKCLNRFHLNSFYLETTKIEELPEKIDILILDFNSGREPFMERLQDLKGRLGKNSLVWVQSKNREIPPSNIPLTPLSIDLLEEDSLVRVYQAGV